MEDTTEPTPEPTTNGIDPSSMHRRLSKVTAQRRDALAQVSDMQSQLDAAEQRAALAEALATRVRELESTNAQLTANHTRAMALVNAGVQDTEAREFILHKFNRTTDAGDFAEWLAGQRESATGFMAQAFGQSAPTAQAPQVPQPLAETVTSPGHRSPPALNKGAHAAPTGSDTLSVDAIMDPRNDFNEILAKMGLTLDPKKPGR